MKEWGFEEDSKDVDLERLYRELSGRVIVEVQSYLAALQRNAPIVYKRFRKKYSNIGCVKV